MSVSTLGDFVQRNGALFPLRLAASGSRRALNLLNTARWRLAGARIGKGSVVECGARIGRPRDVTIGRDCRIGRGVLIDAETGTGLLFVGDDVAVNEGVRLDHTGTLTLEDEVTISHEAVLYTHSHGADPRSKPRPRPLLVGAGAWIGARAMVMANVDEIGSASVVAAGAIVTKSVPEGGVVGGNPAKAMR